MNAITAIRRIPGKLRRLLAIRALNRRFQNEDPGAPASDLPIEVLVPVIAKDLLALPLCIESIRRFVRHPISKIRLITRPDDQMKSAAQCLGASLIDENQLLSQDARQLKFLVNGADRSGWIKQQLLKLSADAIVETNRFLVVDADTAFVRDIVFSRDGKDLLFCSGSYHGPYYQAIRNLTGIRKRYPLSFVSHHMLFNVEHVRQLRQTIEQFTRKRWDLAILDLLNPHIPSGFSEYEIYGNYCAARKADAVDMRFWHNKSVSSNTIPPLDEAVRQYGHDYFTVSFHAYLRPADQPSTPLQSTP